MSIPDEAVEAAADWLPHSDDCESRPERDCTCRHPRLAIMRGALEGAYPILLSHELEQTRLAHLDAVVNVATVGILQEKLELAEARLHNYERGGW